MRTILVLLFSLLPALPALAAEGHDMGAHGAASAPTMAGAMERMHADMGKVAPTGDPDRDFAALMIPHHQGAVEMARAYLAQGKDPEMRKLAEGIIAAQEKEIAFLRAFLAKGKGGGTP